MKLQNCTFCLLLFVTGILVSCGHNAETEMQIPNVTDILSNMDYLDSLFQCESVDSISRVADQLNTFLNSLPAPVQSIDDQLIADSLVRINRSVQNFLQFCNNSRADLELLRQDILAAQSEYQSGRMKTGRYVSALLECEQIQVNMNGQLTDNYKKVSTLLKNKDLLMSLRVHAQQEMNQP